MAEPPYKKNLERLASLQDRLSKVQKTAESLLATVSGENPPHRPELPCMEQLPRTRGA